MTRHLRVARRLARDPNVPAWLRAVLVFGLLPIPGPVDNVALVVGLVVLWVCHRDAIRAQYAYEASLSPVLALDTWGAWA